jgi:hypothetical protein
MNEARTAAIAAVFVDARVSQTQVIPYREPRPGKHSSSVPSHVDDLIGRRLSPRCARSRLLCCHELGTRHQANRRGRRPTGEQVAIADTDRGAGQRLTDSTGSLFVPCDVSSLGDNQAAINATLRPNTHSSA